MDWDMHPMEDLTDMCIERGLDPSGKRDDLITRLEASKTPRARRQPTEPEPEPEPQPETEPEP